MNATLKSGIIGLFLFLALLVAPAEAQPARIEGTVRGPDELPVRGAYVLVEQSRFTAVTDAQGHFVIDGPEIGFEGTVSVTYPEFRQEKRNVTVTEPLTTLTFALQPRIKPEPVVAQDVPLFDAGHANRVAITPEGAVSLPSLGERDAIRALQLLPRVTQQETTAGVAVRGGTSDQTLLRLDGITLYDEDHLFGYVSALDMNAVERVQVGAGPFDARDAGRLSGAVGVVGRSGNARRAGGSATIDLLDANGLAEVPFGGRGSALVAARRTYPTKLSKWILSNVDGTPGPKSEATQGTNSLTGSVASEPTSEFSDLHGKVLVQPSANDRVSFTVYRGREDLDLSRDTGLPLAVVDRLDALGITTPSVFHVSEPGHTLQTGAGAEWARVWSDRLQTQVSAARTTFEGTHRRTGDIGAIRNTLDERSTIEERIGRVGVSVQIPGGHTLELGGELADHANTSLYKNAWVDTTVRAGGVPVDPFRDGALRDPNATLDRAGRGRLTSVYVQDRLVASNRLSLTPGIRVTRFDRTDQWYTEPHVIGRVHLTDPFSITGGWGRASQFVMQVEREDLLRGNRRFWTLADPTRVPVAASTELVGGASYSTAGLLVEVQGFRKEWKDLTIFAPGLASDAFVIDAARFLRHGTGMARGLEALVQEKIAGNTASVSYTRARIEQTFRDLLPVAFPTDQDRRHEVKAVDSFKIGALTIAGIWTFSTGRPVTPVIENVTVTQGETPEGGVAPPPVITESVFIGAKNSARLPTQHRLDVSFTRGVRFGARQAMFGASVLNLYDHTNIWYKEFTSVSGEIVASDILLMSRTFNAFFTVKF